MDTLCDNGLDHRWTQHILKEEGGREANCRRAVNMILGRIVVQPTSNLRPRQPESSPARARINGCKRTKPNRNLEIETMK